jgi:DNA-binding GntR family transcriptional regulator
MGPAPTDGMRMPQLENERERRGEGSTRSAIPKPPSLAEHARRILRDDILAGRLAPGERLTEAGITDRTGISRTPVREAMRLLQSEGLVTAERDRGTYVADRLSRDDALIIYRCRLLIEPPMTRAAAHKAGPPEVDRLEEILGRFKAAVGGERDTYLISSIDAEFHSAIYDASKSELVAIFRSYWAKLQLQLSARVYDRETPQHFCVEHEAIVAAIRAHDGATAARVMTSHIKRGKLRIEESFAEGADA